MAIRVAEAEGKPLVYEREDRLVITLEADVAADLNVEASRKYAYEKRGQYGFGTAGIDNCGGCFTATTEDQQTVFRREVSLYRSPI